VYDYQNIFFFISCNVPVIPLRKYRLGFQRALLLLFLNLLCCLSVYFILYTFNNSVLKNIWSISKGALQLHGNFYLSLVLQKMQVSESVLSNLLKTCICTFRNGPTCSLPAPTWTTSSSSSCWLLLLLLLLLEGWIYFAHVILRKFTKTTTIWVQTLHNFTYFISSDSFFVKYILNYNSIQDFPLCSGRIKHQLTTIRVHWYFQNCMLGEKYDDSLWVTSGVKCDKRKAASSQMSYSLLHKCSLWGSSIHTSMSCTKLNSHWNYYKHGGV
jgi:hypothetical protein